MARPSPGEYPWREMHPKSVALIAPWREIYLGSVDTRPNQPDAIGISLNRLWVRIYDAHEDAHHILSRRRPLNAHGPVTTRPAYPKAGNKCFARQSADCRRERSPDQHLPRRRAGVDPSHRGKANPTLAASEQGRARQFKRLCGEAWFAARPLSAILMARFDLYRMPSGGNGYLLDVQASFLSQLDTRVVVPLLPLDEAPRPAARLNPRFHIGTDEFTMVTQFLAAVPRSMLHSAVGNLSDHHSDIVSAIDFLMQGF